MSLKTDDTRRVVIALWLVSLCLMVLCLWRPIMEQWYLWRLSSSEYSIRYSASMQLAEMNSKRALPVFLARIRVQARLSADRADGIQYDRNWIYVSALIKLGALAVPGLFELLSSQNEEEVVIKYVRDILRDIGSHSIPAFLNALSLSRACARKAAIVSLYDILYEMMETECNKEEFISRKEEFISRLADLIKRDDSAEVRSTAAWALGNIKPTSISTLLNLSQALRDPDENVKDDARIAIFSLVVSSAEILISVFDNGNQDLVSAAIKCLEFDPRQAESIPLLRRTLESKVIGEREFAARALRKFHGEDSGLGNKRSSGGTPAR